MTRALSPLSMLPGRGGKEPSRAGDTTRGDTGVLLTHGTEVTPSSLAPESSLRSHWEMSPARQLRHVADPGVPLGGVRCVGPRGLRAGGSGHTGDRQSAAMPTAFPFQRGPEAHRARASMPVTAASSLLLPARSGLATVGAGATRTFGAPAERPRGSCPPRPSRAPTPQASMRRGSGQQAPGPPVLGTFRGNERGILGRRGRVLPGSRSCHFLEFRLMQRGLLSGSCTHTPAVRKGARREEPPKSGCGVQGEEGPGPTVGAETED